ncbi:hypothetical protein [Streptomyces sp. NPDC056056]|uniref:hypothetical protein n=1 Tax=Streptomyces sp. NPDC056056 TaxID=3345698 RepID=UPI0035E20205
MHPVSGPFPIFTEVTDPTSNRFFKTTEPERGMTMLAHFVRFTDDDTYEDADGLEALQHRSRHRVCRRSDTRRPHLRLRPRGWRRRRTPHHE